MKLTRETVPQLGELLGKVRETAINAGIWEDDADRTLGEAGEILKAVWAYHSACCDVVIEGRKTLNAEA